MEKIVLAEKFQAVSEHWFPHIVAELNGQQVKVAKFLGAFDWHSHADEDELFWVISGVLEIQFRDRNVILNPGEVLVIPRGVEHRPVCEAEVQVVLFEPASTVNTGQEENEKTRTNLPRL